MPSQPISLDAPIEGWNAFHAKDNMPPTAAIILDNIIPGAGRCDTRRGSDMHIDLGTAAPVETVFSFNGLTTKQLIAASNGGIWSINSDPAATEVAAASTYSNSRWQCANFRKADENNVLLMCNGTDNAQVYNGTTIRDLIDTDTVGIDFIGVEVFKGRAYYWKDDDNAFYYAQAGAYEGTLKKFDLGTFVQQGGKITLIATWTQADAGDGRDDFIVFVFSTGEVIVYQGDDPETGGYWEMVGRYVTAEPLSIRGYAKYGSDTIIMTKDGYVALSTILQQGRISDVTAFSQLIHSAVTDATATYGDNYGWECTLFQRDGLFLFNVPISDDTFQQHVMNTVTKRWCRFTGINVITMCVHQERLYGGSIDGKIMSLLEGTSDAGNQIEFTALYAYQQLDNPGTQKHLIAAQVVSTHPKPSLIELSGYADYETPTLAPLTVPASINAAVWDVADWDLADWADDDASGLTTKGWQNVSAFGYGVSLLVRFALVSESVIWRSTGLRYSLAGAH